MEVIVIGAGASGITAAINIKRNHPKDDVLIIEHLDKPLKKILATGNGKCNLGNAKIDFNRYNNSEFAKKIISDYDYEKFFDSISIKTKLIGDLAYPISESAVSVREALLNEVKRLGIKINLEEEIVDYIVDNKIEVITNKSKYIVDKLVLAGGLKSSPKLGSDGSLIKIIQKHGYLVKEPQVGLAPLFTKERTKELDGTRVKANVSLYSNNKLIHSEEGEVLFKEHGLSGIVVFNTLSLISRNPNKTYKISLDLLPNYSDEYLKNYSNSHTFSDLLLAFVNPKISDYLNKRYQNKGDILKALKSLDFTFEKAADFEFSQVSVGGISISEINHNMESKKEKNVYIVGELLDIDGPCGGYNLTWAFASGLLIK